MAETIFYKRVSFLEWIQSHLPHTQYDLATSYVYSLKLAELGIEPAALDMSSSDIKSTRLLAHKYSLEPDNFFLTHGASMALYVVYNSIVRPGDEVLLEAPNYEPLYRLAVKLGAQVKMIDRSPEKGYKLDIEEFQRKVSKNTRMVVLSNIHNPSGSFTDKHTLQALADIAKDTNTYVLCSEVFLDNLLEGEPVSACRFGNNMITINSLSKVYGLPEIRFGWIVCRDDRVRRRISVLINHYLGKMTPLIDQIATFALKREAELIKRSKEVISRNIGIMDDWVKSQKHVSWVRPEGGSVCLVKLPPRIDSMNFAQYLLEKYKTLVAPGNFFWKSGYIRVSLGQSEDTLRTGLNYVSRSIAEVLESL